MNHSLTQSVASRRTSVASPFRAERRTPSLFRKVSTCLILATAITVGGSRDVSAAPLVWDAGSGSDFLWSTVGNWSGGEPTALDDLTFSLTIPNPGALSDPQIIGLGTGEVANSLSFRNSYTLDGGELSLTSGRITVDLGMQATISSKLVQSTGLNLTGSGNSGRGVLRLTNNTNTYTGTTTIGGGTLIIDAAGALGTDTSAIVVTGSAVGGANGGTLLLAGSYSGGVTITRALSLASGGPTNNPPNANVTVNSGAALLSVGNNTITGPITASTGSVNSGIISTFGLLTLGNLTASGTVGTASTRTIIGSVGSIGNTVITGALAGGGVIDKGGSGTLLLTPSSTTGFTGAVRVNPLGSVRIASGAVLGTNATASTTSPIDLYGGILEVRSDAPAIGKNVYQNRSGGTSSIIFADHAPGTNVINQTAAFGMLNFSTIADSTVGMTFAGRNGYGISFSAGNKTVSVTNGNFNFTNNLNGLLTFTGNFWELADTTGIRTLTFNGTGDTLITDNVLASGAAHILTKSGAGSLTIGGTGSTYSGATNIQQGTLVVGDFRAISNTTGNTAPLTLGNSTTAGTLTIQGTSPTAAGLITGKVISLLGTTGNGTINASQAGTNPVVFTSTASIVAGAGTKTLTLGGTNTASNLISGAFTDNSAANITMLVKTDVGTWALGGTNTNTGSTLITGGTLQLNAAAAGATVLRDTTAVGFGLNAATQRAGGTLELVGLESVAADEVVGPLGVISGANTVKVTAGGGVGTASLTFASLGTTTTATAATTTATMTVGSTAGLVPGMLVTGAGVPVNAYITGITSGTTFTTSAASSVANGASLTFSRPVPFASNLNSGGTVNFVTSLGGSVNIASVPAIGLLSAYTYFNGADFAYAEATTNAMLRVPVYEGVGVDAGFNTVASAATLTTGSNNQITSSSGVSGVVTQAAPVTIPTLKLNAGTTLTANALVTIQGTTNNPGGILLSGGAATIDGASGITAGAGGEIAIRTDLSTDTLTLATPITTGGFSKNGEGTLIITAVNTHTSPTIINEGLVKISGSGRISGSTSSLVIRQGATLDLNGRSTAINATTTTTGHFNGAGTVTNSSATPAEFVLGGGGGGGTFSGVIEDGNGVMNVTKITQGSQTLSGLNTYTGVTTIGGTGLISVTTLANIGSPSGIGKGSPTLTDEANAGSLVFNGTSTTQVYGGLTYTGIASVSIDRLFTLNGTTDGGVRILANGANNATLIFNNPAPLLFGTTAAGKAQGLALGGASTGDNRFNPRITDNGAAITSLYKTDAGVWHLGNAANSYTGVTRIDGGALGAMDGSTLPSASNLTFNGGVLESTGSFTRTLGTAGGKVQWTASGSGGFSAGASKLTVDLGSAPIWGSTAGFLGTGSLILSSATALSEVVMASGFEVIPAAASSFNATTTAGSATVTLTTGSTAGLIPGQVIDGSSNIPNGSTIASITSATVFTLTSGTGVLAATGAATNVSAGGYRAITVNDNVNTYTDLATITGAITGPGNVGKLGTGILQLLGDNTYAGYTTVGAGTLVVTKLGDSAEAGGSSSVGSTTNANFLTSAVVLGIGTSTAGILNYVGPGETSDRYIQINTTVGTTQIVADGTGPLILTNLRNTGATGAKTLSLRGANSLPNMITSDLADNGGTLGLSHDTAGTWILTGNNIGMTGAVTFSGGAMGVGSDTAFGTGEINIHNTTLFAYDTDRSINNVINHNGTGGNPIIFVGDYSLTFTNALWKNRATTANNIITNNIVDGKFLTINSTIEGAPTGTAPRILSFNGSGATIVNGVINTTTAIAQGVTYSGTGSLTLTGASTFDGPVLISSGTVKVNAINGAGVAQPLGRATTAITLGAAATNGTLEYTGTAPATLTRPISIGNAGPGGTIRNSGGALLTLSGGVAKSGGKLTLTGGSFDVTGVISGATAANAEMIVDNATVLLSIANTYSGPTRVQGDGLLRNGIAAALPVGTSLTLGEATGNTGGTYDLNGISATIAGLASAGTGTKIIINGAASGTSILTVTAGGTYAGSIQDGATAATGLLKKTADTLVLSGSNNYTGPTTVEGGTLNVSGSLSGTVNVTLTGGTLILGASNVLNDDAPIALGGGTLAANGFSEGTATTAGLGNLSLSATSTLDFGGTTGSTLFFAGLGTHTGGSLLQITNWNSTNDRLLFAGLSSSFTTLFPQEQVSFNSVPGYAAIQFGTTHFEIVAVPEPSSTALIGAAGLLGLVGFRERRRWRRLTSAGKR